MKTPQCSAVIVSVVFAGIVFQRAMAHLPAESAALGATMAAGPETQPAPQPAAVQVKIDNFNFQPKEIVVSVGTIVTWTNVDDVPHTATDKGEDPAFDSGPIDTDEKFSFTFTKPGVYPYYCKVHPHMTGLITVK